MEKNTKLIVKFVTASNLEKLNDAANKEIEKMEKNNYSLVSTPLIPTPIDDCGFKCLTVSLLFEKK